MATGQWVKIEDRNQPLKKGDRLQLWFDAWSFSTYVLAAQVAAIEWSLKDNPDFKVRSHSIPSNKEFNFEIEILHDSPVTLALILTVIAAISISVMLTFRYAYLWQAEGGVGVAEVIEETGWSALKIAAAAILGVVALKWWGK